MSTDDPTKRSSDQWRAVMEGLQDKIDKVDKSISVPKVEPPPEPARKRKRTTSAHWRTVMTERLKRNNPEAGHPGREPEKAKAPDPARKPKRTTSAHWRAVMTESLQKKAIKKGDLKPEPAASPPSPPPRPRTKSSAQWRAAMTESLNRPQGKDPKQGSARVRPATRGAGMRTAASAGSGPLVSRKGPPGDEGSSENRRNNERVPYKLKVQWIAGKERYDGEAQDISECGVRLTSSRPVPLHTRIKVFIPLPGSDAQQHQMYLIEGVVVRSEDGETGVYFVNLPLDVRVLIRDLVSRGF